MSVKISYLPCYMPKVYIFNADYLIPRINSNVIANSFVTFCRRMLMLVELSLKVKIFSALNKSSNLRV